jgi:glutamine synthetase
MSEAGRGRLDLAALERAAGDGSIHTVVTALPDLFGRLVGKRISVRFFLDAIAAGGMHVCDYLLACDMEMDPTPGYAFTNWQSGYGDLHLVPDLSTLRRATWQQGTAIVLCDAFGADGLPVEVSPRRILQRQLAQLAERGLCAKMGSELEFFLLRDDYSAVHAKGYRNLVSTQHYAEDYHILSSTRVEDVIGAIRAHVDASGIEVEFSKGEWSPGQHEINLRYAEALEMADRHVIYKLAAKEIAASAGRSLTFMAKFDESLAGSSLHVHASLWTQSDDAPAFAGDRALAGAPVTSSDAFRHFLGGVLAHAREIALLFAPNPNSYKRYRTGTFAPTRIAWSYDNRTAGFRVIGEGESLRVECRIPGADANPYLAYAGLLAAGLDGLERRIEPGPAFSGDAYSAADLPQVPTTLPEAADAFERSEFARRAFGDAVVAHLLHFARTEQRQLDARVSDVERGRYFERV